MNAPLSCAVRRANDACKRHDVASLTDAIRSVVEHAPDLAIDLDSIIELAPFDLELAEIRWGNLRRKLS
jgi:hypothetical protein